MYILIRKQKNYLVINTNYDLISGQPWNAYVMKLIDNEMNAISYKNNLYKKEYKRYQQKSLHHVYTMYMMSYKSRLPSNIIFTLSYQT